MGGKHVPNNLGSGADVQSDTGFATNWELSGARATNVTKLLIDNGVPATRISATGYADTQPVADNETEEGRALNRRIEIALQPNLDELPDLSRFENGQ